MDIRDRVAEDAREGVDDSDTKVVGLGGKHNTGRLETRECDVGFRRQDDEMRRVSSHERGVLKNTGSVGRLGEERQVSGYG